ncbi:MarR family transcriptional regulator [Pseudanabaenaceae cyanobacterium LEGE 13415]|nr:MarR family transcriptional regulator [Pseudanabaenaceae cyanobacterium LEGE 13415]
MAETPFDTLTDPIEQRILTGLAKIGLALRSQSWQDAGQLGLTPTQGQILTLLIEDGESRLSDVAKQLGVTAATASDAVTSLVEKGLVQKNRSSQDGRAIAITLTSQGRQAAIQAASWSDFLLETVDELSEEEKVIFLRGLIKMIRKLQQQGQISVARMCVTCQFFQPNQYPGSEHPHHCALVNAPFSDGHLRIHCADHVAKFT